MSGTTLKHRVVDLGALDAASETKTASNLSAKEMRVARASSPSEEMATFTPPTFTMKELLDVIPQHCYERSALKSSAYVAMDFAMIGALAYAVSHVATLLGSNGALLDGWIGQVARWAAWATYCTWLCRALRTCVLI